MSNQSVSIGFGARVDSAAKQIRHITSRGGEIALVMAAQGGDERACAELCCKYHGLIRWKARSYFLAGGDDDDVIQEGLIGLFKAIRDFDFSRQASFRAFADMCITRQIISAVKTAARRKHVPLNAYISLSPSAAGERDGLPPLADVLAADGAIDPAEVVVAAWMSDFIRSGIAEVMSSLESKALALHSEGHSYREIAEVLACGTKAVDNALQRAKRKVENRVMLCRAS